MGNIAQFKNLGTILAAIGFTLLSMNIWFWGFTIGLFSCIILITYFIENYEHGFGLLQMYFLCANILGMFNNWGNFGL